MLKNFEELLKKYFRYLLSKFLGAVGSSQVQKSVFKHYKMLLNALKNPKSFLHVAVVRNIRTVVVETNNINDLQDFEKTRNMHNSAF